MCSPCGSAGKESACHVGELGSMPGLGRSPGEGKGYLLQYSGLENSMDCIVHGVTKSWATFTFKGGFMLVPALIYCGLCSFTVSFTGVLACQGEVFCGPKHCLHVAADTSQSGAPQPFSVINRIIGIVSLRQHHLFS